MMLRRNLSIPPGHSGLQGIAAVTTETLELIETVPADCTGTCNTCPAVGTCPDRLVCRCLKVTEERIILAIRDHGLTSVTELKTVTGAGDGCRCCHRELKQYLMVYSPSSPSPSMC